MMKRVIIALLVFTYLNFYIGCTRNLTFNDRVIDKSTNDRELTIMTHDSTIYTFEASMYQFSGDTLEGYGTISGENKDYMVKIAMTDISKIGKSSSQVNWNAINSLANGLGIFALIAGLIFISFISAGN